MKTFEPSADSPPCPARTSRAEWWIDGAEKARQSVTADWQFTSRPLIDGVAIHEIRSVPTGYGVLTEMFRREWLPEAGDVGQVFGVVLIPGAVSGWHVHDGTTDRFFAAVGMIKLVLYDARTGSRSRGRINELMLTAARPALYTVPPGVWHAVKNMWHETSHLLNIPDRAYQYEDPDHWTLPADTSAIPYRL